MKDFYTTNKECYDKIASKFKDSWEEVEDWQLEERKKFLQYLDKNPAVLDLGCGQGRDLMILTKLGAKCTGLDFSISQLKLAKERNVAELVHSSFSSMPFKSNSFDGVWSCVTLLHVKREDFVGVIRSVKNILKPNGVFFLSLQEGIGEEVVRREIYGKIPMVIVYYMPDEIEAILKKEGFSILDYERHHVWKGIEEKERVFFNFYVRKEGM